METLLLLFTLLFMTAAGYSQEQENQAAAGLFFKSGNRKISDRDFQGALADFSTALRLEPANAHLCYDKTGDYPHAAACFQKALELSPGYIPALDNLGFCFLAGKEYAKAAGTFTLNLTRQPANPDTLLGMALASFYLEDAVNAGKFIAQAWGLSARLKQEGDAYELPWRVGWQFTEKDRAVLEKMFAANR